MKKEKLASRYCIDSLMHPLIPGEEEERKMVEEKAGEKAANRFSSVFVPTSNAAATSVTTYECVYAVGEN